LPLPPQSVCSWWRWLLTTMMLSVIYSIIPPLCTLVSAGHWLWLPGWEISWTLWFRQVLWWPASLWPSTQSRLPWDAHIPKIGLWGHRKNRSQDVCDQNHILSHSYRTNSKLLCPHWLCSAEDQVNGWAQKSLWNLCVPAPGGFSFFMAQVFIHTSNLLTGILRAKESLLPFFTLHSPPCSILWSVPWGTRMWRGLSWRY
jgi:hypothetical protein